jgi:L-fuconolactonase
MVEYWLECRPSQIEDGGRRMGLDITGQYRYPAPNAQWLALLKEDIIEPNLPIVDAHHHIWREPGNPYLLPDLMADVSSGHNIVATVFVQCNFSYRTAGPEHLRSVGETEHVEAMVAASAALGFTGRLCAGIVAFADLTKPELIDEVLDAHLLAAPDRFRGIRQSASRDSNFPEGIVVRPAPAGMLRESNFRRSIRRIADRGLTFDAMIYHQQLDELTDLARAAERAEIVVDHFGCPLGIGPYRGRKCDVFDAWRRDIKELARCPNTKVKLGGLGMIICGAQYHLESAPPSSHVLAEAWRPMVETCIEQFGADRCMFESNFPVDKAMFSYSVLWNAFKRLSLNATAEEKADLFSRTASRAYRLNLPQ